MKLYMVRTRAGGRYYARADNGHQALRRVNDHLAYWRLPRDPVDYAVNAFNWDDQLVVPA